MSDNRSQSYKERAIPYARHHIDEADIQAVVEVLRSDFLTQGPKIEAFEKELCEVSGAKYAVAVSSGTAALHIACMCLGIGKGDTGIVPANTFVATANCLRYCQGEVAFCGVDERTGKAGVKHFRELVESGVTPKVILPVSFAGSAKGLAEVKAYADQIGAKVIEDAAHSLGASYVAADGRTYRSGSCSHSDLAILSFHPVKHICAGEGGAVLTNDAEIAQRARRLRSHGIEKTDAVRDAEGPWAYDQLELGYHYRMTDIQAALGLSQLKKLPGFLERRRAIAKRYLELLDKEPFSSKFELPEKDEGSAWHLFVLRFANKEMRKRAYGYLHEQGIRVQVHYRPVFLNEYYNGEQAVETGNAFYLSLPLYPLLSDEDIERVAHCLREFCFNDSI
ncbi:MAG: aminotransferase class I/II-fold pyridoxal phosphate-dependent enzyme [Verrucomicrobiota bacterium]